MALALDHVARPLVPAARVRRISLQDFRSYAALDLAVDAPLVALTGENGAGKTNILEALSFLCPGRGLRRAELADVARLGGPGGWAVSAIIDAAMDEPVRLGTGLERAEGGLLQRRNRVDREPAASAAAFADWVRLVWLTPELDGLFRGPPGERRRFLDRLVLAVDAEHAARGSRFDRALRGRNRLLQDPGSDARWLDAIEHEVAEHGVALAAARLETVRRLRGVVEDTRDDASPFPWAALELRGELESALALAPALDVEDSYRAALREARDRDRVAGRALMGPQTSDLSVVHGPKGVAAAGASTGEQKALLVGLVLAHARLVWAMCAQRPLVLLDEVAAHLDPRRRAALYEALSALDCQVWMTGADPALFSDLPAGSATFRVVPGGVEPLAR